MREGIGEIEKEFLIKKYISSGLTKKKATLRLTKLLSYMVMVNTIII